MRYNSYNSKAIHRFHELLPGYNSKAIHHTIQKQFTAGELYPKCLFLLVNYTIQIQKAIQRELSNVFKGLIQFKIHPPTGGALGRTYPAFGAGPARPFRAPAGDAFELYRARAERRSHG